MHYRTFFRLKYDSVKIRIVNAMDRQAAVGYYGSFPANALEMKQADKQTLK